MPTTDFDFTVSNHGNIFILNAISDDAETWCDDHLPDDCQMFGQNGYVIEHRYIADIVTGIQSDDLTVE